jgi:predicted enzyme related to lactoylglutathione lyase
MGEQESAPKGIGVIGDVVIDVADLERGGRFWSQILGVEIAFRHRQFWWLGEQHSGAPHVVLQRTDEEKVVKNRAHLDIRVESLDAALARIEELGGSRLREVVEPEYSLWVVADPDGNEFCLIPPQEPS